MAIEKNGQRPGQPVADGPLVLDAQGYFFVGGHYQAAPGASPMVGQMYVEYQIPHRLQHVPIVMIHGGSQTGTNFTGTPDGREGWAQYFLRRGWPVYVVDTVGRGRSNASLTAYGALEDPSMEWFDSHFVASERFGLWPQAGKHTQFPGTGQAGDPSYDQFLAAQVPSIADYTEQQRLNAHAGIALLDRIGPAVLLTHSQSGTFGWLIADQRPDLVRGIVAVEPNGPPGYAVTLQGPPDWFADKPGLKVGGLAHLPLTYDPPISDGEQLQVVCEADAQGPGLARCWRQSEPARQLVNLAKVPTMILQGEASYHAPYDHCTSQYLTQAGVQNSFIRLVDRGIRGNGHMMMLEKNNVEIAGVIHEWLAQNTRTAVAA